MRNKIKKQVIKLRRKILKKRNPSSTQKKAIITRDIISNSKNQEDLVLKIIDNYNLNKKNVKLYKTVEELKENWDLSDQELLQEAHYCFNNEKMIQTSSEKYIHDIQINKNLKKLSDKFSLLQKKYMIVAKGKKEWNKNKKAVGMVIPVPEAINFYFDTFFFITLDVLSEISKSKNVFSELFDTENLSTNEIYKYMVFNDIENLMIYRIGNSHIMIEHKSNGEKNERQNAFSNESKRRLIKMFKSDIKVNEGDKSSEIKGTKHFSLENIISKSDSLPINNSTFRITLQAQSNKRSTFLTRDQVDYTIDIRNLNTGKKLRKPEEIGYLPEDLEKIKNCLFDDRLNEPVKKLTAFVGAPSSGKSTTIASIVQYYLWDEKRQIATWLDETQEFELNGIQHIDFSENDKNRNKEAVQSWESSFQTTLTKKIDFICFGEVIGDEAIKYCMKAVGRGRGVFNTAHTSDCHSFIIKIEDLGFRPAQYIPYLGQIIHHEFVPGKCDCSDNKECKKCKGSGLYGKVLIYERVEFTNKIPLNANLVNDFYEYIKSGQILYKSKYEVAKSKYEQGLITEEILLSFEENKRI